MEKKILVVDDEDYIRVLIVQTIEAAFEDFVIDEKLEVLEANNGKDCLQIAKKESPDLIFLDVMIPNINGFDVCQEIKENPEYEKKPYIILLTAKGQEVDKEKGFSAGANEYMTKPFVPEEIVSRAEKELNIKRRYYYE